MAKASDFDPRVLKLFDGYIHGNITRRQFIEEAAALASERTLEHFARHLKPGVP